MGPARRSGSSIDCARGRWGTRYRSPVHQWIVALWMSLPVAEPPKEGAAASPPAAGERLLGGEPILDEGSFSVAYAGMHARLKTVRSFSCALTATRLVCLRARRFEQAGAWAKPAARDLELTRADVRAVEADGAQIKVVTARRTVHLAPVDARGTVDATQLARWTQQLRTWARPPHVSGDVPLDSLPQQKSAAPAQ